VLILLGCCHEVQPLRPKPGWEHQQAACKELLSSLVVDHGVEMVAEEGSQREYTIAQAIACEHACAYQNLDVDLDTQSRIEKAPLKTLDEVTGAWLPHQDFQYARAWSLVREYHIFRKFVAFNPDHLPTILICGKLHLAGFHKLFALWPDLRTLCFGARRDVCCDRWDDSKLFDFPVVGRN